MSANAIDWRYAETVAAEALRRNKAMVLSGETFRSRQRSAWRLGQSPSTPISR